MTSKTFPPIPTDKRVDIEDEAVPKFISLYFSKTIKRVEGDFAGSYDVTSWDEKEEGSKSIRKARGHLTSFVMRNIDAHTRHRFQNNLDEEYHYLDDRHHSGDNFGGFHIEINLANFVRKLSDEELLQFAVDVGVVIPSLTYSVKEITAYIPEPQHEEYGLHHFDEAYKKIMSDPANAVMDACKSLEGICKKIAKDRGKKVGTENIPDLLEKFLNDDDFFIEPEIRGRTKKMIEDAGELAKKNKEMIEEMGDTIRNIRNDHAHAGSEKLTINDPYHASFIVNTVATVGLFLLQNHHKTKKIL